MSDEILMDIQRALGRIEAKTDVYASSLTQHVADDKVVAKALFERIETLQLASAKQKGALTVLGALGSMIGAGVGYLLERFIFGTHA